MDLKNKLTRVIPWNPFSASSNFTIASWVATESTCTTTLDPQWVYQLTEIFTNTVDDLEFKLISPLHLSNSSKGTPHSSPLRTCNPFEYSAARPTTPKSPGPRIIQPGKIKDQATWPRPHYTPSLGPPGLVLPSWRRVAKGRILQLYLQEMLPHVHLPQTSPFLASLDKLRMASPARNLLLARLWHNSRPQKVATFPWLALNQGLLVGTWLKKMGLDPSIMPR